HEARPVDDAGAARPTHAGARHRRVRGDRCGRPLPERGRAADDRLDAELREHPAEAFRLPGDEGLLALHPVSRALTARPLLPVLAAQADASLSSSARRLLTLVAGLLAVGLVLLAVYRNLERALVPLIPIALATGWSALILFLIGIPLNPMSAAMGVLVIVIS